MCGTLGRIFTESYKCYKMKNTTYNIKKQNESLILKGKVQVRIY